MIARYAYDFAGRLILRTAADGSKERYYYDAGLSRVLVRVKPAGESAWKTKYVYALNGGVAGQVLAERTVTAWSGTTPTAWNDIWLHYDLLGNVVGWHGPSGEFTRADRDAYGRPLPGTIAAQTPSGYGLTTKPRDPATGLIWFGARWYDPDNGRWIEPEPSGADGPNLYWSFDSSPVRAADMDGRRSISFDGSVLTMHGDDGTATTCSAFSGQGGTDYTKENIGPIPPGRWTMYPEKLQLLVPSPDWGKFRIPLGPSRNTPTYGRKDFYLHGSGPQKTTTSGCTSVGVNEDPVIEFIQGSQDPIHYNVSY